MSEQRRLYDSGKIEFAARAALELPTFLDINGTAHFVMLDNGLTDHNFPNPMQRMYGYAKYQFGFLREVIRIKQIIREMGE